MEHPEIRDSSDNQMADMPQGITTFVETTHGDGVDRSYVVSAPYDLSTYRIEDHQIKINDAVWGKHIIGHEPGDEVFLELVGHSTIARSQAVEQLTSPAFMTTIAGMSGMPRWDHGWGSMVLARMIGRQLDLSPEESRRKELRALLSDMSQWAFSHLGDFMLQGMGGPEDAHDSNQLRLLVATGVGEVVARHGYDIEELLVSSDTQPWEECPKPNLNIDNLDYLLRQSLRMFAGVPELTEGVKQFPFIINENGNVVVTDQKFARVLTKAALLLPTEHWQEPTHRLLLVQLQEMVRHQIVRYGPATMHFFFGGSGGINPQDALMSVDYDFETGMHTSSPFMWAMKDVARQIAAEKRIIYHTTREGYLNRFVSSTRPSAFPDPMVPGGIHADRHALFPSGVHFIQVNQLEEVEDYGNNPYTVDLPLPALKRRYIDPLVRMPDGTDVPLSESEGNEDIADLIVAQAEILARNYVGRLLVNPTYKKIIEQNIEENKKLWDEQIKMPRMDDETFRRYFEDVSNLAKGVRKTQIEWWR
jgi:hypothetical protein